MQTPRLLTVFPPPGGRAADGHAGHVRQPVNAEGLGHRLRSEHHDQLHAGRVTTC